MLVFVGLILAGITRSTEGILSFTQEPNSTVYFMKGSDAVIKWDYKVENRTLFSFISWSALNRTTQNYEVLIAEYENGNVQLNPALSPEYHDRVQKEGRATLIIKSVTFEDSTKIKCTLKGNVGDIYDRESSVTLVVTGPASVSPGAQFSKVGGHAAFTCNATGVPSQNFTWFWMDGDRRSELKGDGQNVIISSDTGSSQIVLKNIPAGDPRYYVCEARANEDQPSSSKGYLQLPRPLKEDEKSCPTRSFPVATGRNLTICCPVSGYPPPVVTWEKDGIQLQKGEDAIFTIISVDNKDFGNYTCTASDLKTSLGPFFISVIEEYELPVNYTDETAEKAAILKWEAQDGAKYYVVEISGTGVYDDYVVGKMTSLELHYHTFVFEDPKIKSDEITVCATVTAIGDKGIIGKMGKIPRCLTVKSSQVTVEPSLVCLLLLLSVSWKISLEIQD